MFSYLYQIKEIRSKFVVVAIMIC